MMGITHLTAGVAVGIGAGIVTQQPVEIAIIYGLVGGAAALLPDIDHRHSHLRKHFGILGDILLFWLPHRGVTHSALLWLILTLLAVRFVPVVWLPASVGYLSHIALDMTTHAGLAVLWPISRRKLHLLPPGIRFVTGSFTERLVYLLLIVCIFGLLVLLLTV